MICHRERREYVSTCRITWCGSSGSPDYARQICPSQVKVTKIVTRELPTSTKYQQAVGKNRGGATALDDTPPIFGAGWPGACEVRCS